MAGATFYKMTSRDKSIFRGANLTGVDLSSLDLSGFDLTGTNLTSANLTSANLTSANLTKASISGANFARAIIVKLIPNIQFGGIFACPIHPTAQSKRYADMPNGYYCSYCGGWKSY